METQIVQPTVGCNLHRHFLGIAFRGGLQIRNHEPNNLEFIDKSDFPRDGVIADGVTAAFCEIFCLLKPFLEIIAPMESPFK